MDTRWFMGFLDGLLGNPAMQKAQVVIAAGVAKRREETKRVVTELLNARGQIGPNDAELNKILDASSHGTVIREIAKATGVDLLRTLADKLEGKS